MALIYGDQSMWDGFSPAEKESAYEQYRAFSNEASEAGVLVGGDELASTSPTARTPR